MIPDLQFTDVIFTYEGQAMLKGVPGRKGVAPAPIGSDYKWEKLRDKAMLATKDRLNAFVSHEGVPYRVKRMPGPMGKPCLYVRRALQEVPTMERLGYSEYVVEELCKHNAGLVLFAGRQGAGKTTGATTFVKERLIRRGGTAITVECPIELPLDGAHGESGWCQQTEVDAEDMMAPSVSETYRCSSPDVLFLGEIREGNAAVEAMRASITSYVVVTTIHADSIVSAIQRLVMFSLERLGEKPAQELLGQAFLGCVYQQLFPGDTGARLRFKTLFKEQGVGAKIANGHFNALQDVIDSQRNRLAMSGAGGPRRVR